MDMPLKTDLDLLPEKAQNAEKENKAFFKSIKKSRFRELDDTIHAIHEEVFEATDCLECGNCCRSLGPRIIDKDIERMGKNLRMKPTEVIEKYLRVDEDGDYVFQSMPCPFLGEDNYCFIYEDRPKACREYPHTNRRKFFQISSLTVMNARTCPAVYDIIDRLKKRFT
ncbi:MAG: YkgJ family cysteine cluster protein [Bacteroides sp.]|nr:YkgJ family cysteine cluster protein [Bacteroides sp.]